MLSKVLSVLFMLLLTFSSLFGFNLPGYENKELFGDADFSDGFSVVSQETDNGEAKILGNFTYSGSENNPSWMIAQWNSGPCLWTDAAESDEFTLTDGKTKWVTYNGEEKSVSLRLNASEVYNGQPAGESNWPHLLLEQSPLTDYNNLSEKEKAFYKLENNRLVLNLKIRINDFKETTNKEGINAVQFLSYFYLKDTDGHNFIWFGVDLFDSRGYNDTYWAKDSVSNNMIYTVSTKETYGCFSDGLLKNGKPYVSDEWVNVSVDLTPHILQCIENANKDNIFGEKVSLSDFYIGGTNIGFEIHGNYDCTVEIKDFNITSYIK